jgi:hypothetical protein
LLAPGLLAAQASLAQLQGFPASKNAIQRCRLGLLFGRCGWRHVGKWPLGAVEFRMWYKMLVPTADCQDRCPAQQVTCTTGDHAPS